MHTTEAMPSATTVISNVVPPRPATLPVHWTCKPMSVQTGALAPLVMKCPLSANADVAVTPSSMSAAARAMTNRFISFPKKKFEIQSRVARYSQSDEPGSRVVSPPLGLATCPITPCCARRRAGSCADSHGAYDRTRTPAHAVPRRPLLGRVIASEAGSDVVISPRVREKSRSALPARIRLVRGQRGVRMNCLASMSTAAQSTTSSRFTICFYLFPLAARGLKPKHSGKSMCGYAQHNHTAGCHAREATTLWSTPAEINSDCQSPSRQNDQSGGPRQLLPPSHGELSCA